MTTPSSEKKHKAASPSLAVAVFPVALLIILLAINVLIFGDDALSGSNQIILMFVAAVTSVIGFSFGISWRTIERIITNSIHVALPAILVLLLVGALAGTWMLSGIIPALIYYGLGFLNPAIFLVAACIISAVVSVATGSSWTTSATIGIALMGIGQALGIPIGMIGGAVLSGAYFGDKVSPLSDTTNLAAGVSNVELFTHIRYMLFTTLPSFALTLILFAVLSAMHSGAGDARDGEMLQAAIADRYHISLWLFIVPGITLALIVKRIPAVPVLFCAVMMGALAALVFQSDLVREVGGAEQDTWYGYYKGVMISIYGDVAISTGNSSVDDLLSTGGMGGMLGTIWLIIAAMIFGGAMEATGLLQRIVDGIISLVRSTFSLVASTGFTCLFFNVSASDQYLSIVVPGKMFAPMYKKRELAPQNLSRTLEDTGTVTSVLVPWNTCGAFHAGVLGVATLAYLPFCFFNIISPIMTLIYAYFNIKIAKADDGN